MIMVSNMAISWIMVALFCCSALAYSVINTNLCPGIDKCQCKKYMDEHGGESMQIRCSRASNPALYLMPHENITKIQLTGSTFTNWSLLYEMNKTNAHRVSISNNKFGNNSDNYFDWNWLPVTTESVTIAGNGFLKDQCDKAVLMPNFAALYILRENFSSHLSCIPSTTETIYFNDVTVANNALQLKDLPLQSLKKLSIIKSTMDHIFSEEANALKKANKLTLLSIRYAAFVEIPSDLPASLVSLDFAHNNIELVNPEIWTTIPHLKSLDLSGNQLSMVPMGMPNTLETINLHNNAIEYSPLGAFSHMKNLSRLDLSGNKLTNLPRDIHSGIKILSLNDNSLSVVTEEASYLFCENCTSMLIHNNPWLCNTAMLKMLTWLEMRDITWRYFGGNICTKDHFQGMAKVPFAEIMENKRYFSMKHTSKCTYDINSLSCINAGLDNIPDRIPPGLNTISISGNKNLSSIRDNTFASQDDLLSLDLSNNSLMHIPYGLPASLTELNLRNNVISDFRERDVEALRNLTSLKYLHLEDNKIRTLHEWQFEGLTGLRWLGVARNMFHCDCNLMSFTFWYASFINAKQLVSMPSIVLVNHPTCHSPIEVHDRSLLSLHAHFNYRMKCAPETCEWGEPERSLNCSAAYQKRNHTYNLYQVDFVPEEAPQIPRSSYWRSVDFSGLKLTNDQIDLKHLTRLRNVDLSDNQLTEVPVKELPSTIETLMMSGNPLKSIPAHNQLQQLLPNLRLTDMEMEDEERYIGDRIKWMKGRVVFHQQKIQFLKSRVQFLQRKFHARKSKTKSSQKPNRGEGLPS